ncbi:N-acetylglucosamine 6-phosphate deacetylase [Arcticibacter tournemirensis]|uniref:N-acetylglucosamine-6-phosphate deacetylase n=1 Tax=Arcticibacter tournemirensis TaxID=699437 RepID=A0A5M9HHG2_9SPHI|nr:N-acetylglucosamine-6-phosphate deacetylase [Arcticibacter tournemirensis]KAA8484961.1 N-acetylglucosamine-6-phosphate deacetylase [Arcticibacter tournemirensis]TQM50596.1 N-acetylglucosamine 6-phosphate deacetylase [Arcticibacter tournemirensis]
MLTALINGTIFTGDRELKGNAILLDGNTIADITDTASIPERASVIDCSGKYIAPGLLDLQIYGAGGVLFSNEPSVKALESITEGIVKSGTTGFVLTLATNSLEVFKETIRVAKQFRHPAFLGIHFEGPYINPAKRGAHILDCIKKPEINEVESLINEAGGLLKIITLAPEITDPGVIKLLTDNGVIVSAGHSNATFEEARAGFNNGITTVTHLFNAMSPLHHREPGLPGAVFEAEKAYASIVADGIHVAFPVVSASKKVMKERLFLITDAVVAVKEGAYIHVEQEDRYTLPDGTLSGSKLTLLKAIKNCVQHAGIPLDEAIRMASTYPARVIGTSDRGRMEKGYRADLTLFNSDFELTDVFLGGVRQ